MKKVRFSDVLTIINGRNQKQVENPNGKYPIYGSGGIMGYADDFICKEKTVVIGRKGNINKPIFVETPFWNVDTAFGLYANRERLLPKYLYYFCKKYDFEQLNTTVTIPSLTKANLLKIEIPLPPLDTQRHIAAVLDKVSDLIALRKQQLAKLDELVKARFVEMFGDPVRNDKCWGEFSIRELCKKIYGGGTPSKDNPEYFNGEIPWVTPKDMKIMIIKDSKDHITEEAVDKSSASVIPENSVLMVIRSGILKRSLPIAINSVPVTINQDMKAFVPGEMVVAPYLAYYFKSVERDILRRIRGVTADNIDFKDFQKRLIMVPPINLQNQFADFVAKVEKTKSSVQKALAETQVLFDSLMQEYFG